MEISYKVVLFYRYANLSGEVESLCQSLKLFCESFNDDLKGRILVSDEGLNGTIAGSEESVASLVDYLKKLRPSFNYIDFKYSSGVGAQLPFPDLFIKHAKGLIGTGSTGEDIKKFVKFSESSFGGLEPECTGIHLKPQDFHDGLLKHKDKVLLDIRNDMEFEIGHFKGSTSIETKTYAETWKKLDSVIGDVSTDTDSPIYLYCTGGIRCEFASAYLRMKGVARERVFQLEGGIHRYLEAYPNGGLFAGKNFVFDGRLAQPVATACANVNKETSEPVKLAETTPEGAAVVGACLECARPYDKFCPGVVCAVCREPVLVCDVCQTTRADRIPVRVVGDETLGGIEHLSKDGYSWDSQSQEVESIEAATAAGSPGDVWVEIEVSAQEYHCKAHRHLRCMYFKNLQSFSKETLQWQRRLLEKQHTTLLLAGHAEKNRRRTLRRQIERVEARLAEIISTSHSHCNIGEYMVDVRDENTGGKMLNAVGGIWDCPGRFANT